MESFAFYYTIFHDFPFAMKSLEQQSEFEKDFLSAAKKMCDLEAQTFLNDASALELKNVRQILKEKIEIFENKEIFYKKNIFNWSQWRIYIALMCTLYEWCNEVRFFELDTAQREQVFLENPVDWYYKYHEFFEADVDTSSL